MKLDEALPQEIIAIIQKIAYEDSADNQCLPFVLTAEKIAKLIEQAPGHACVLLDFPMVLDTLRRDTFSVEPYGQLRHFDHLYSILQEIPEDYTERLLRNGLLFPEEDTPHFHHLTGLGDFGHKSPSGFINLIFKLLYQRLTCDQFMSAFAEGLTNNPRVNRVFLKEVFDVDLLQLATVLKQFQHIKHVELALSLKPENRENIVRFFNQMRATNPHLHYHIQVRLSPNQDEFIFLSEYLSRVDHQIITLTLVPESAQVRSAYHADLKFKQFFDSCMQVICQNNHRLRQISINDFSVGSNSYRFTNLSRYNMSLFAIGDQKTFAEENPGETSALLLRNRTIHALLKLSNEIRHFQSVLELLPWLTMHRMPPELTVEIFNYLRYGCILPNTVSLFTLLLNEIKNAGTQLQSTTAVVSHLATEIIEEDTFLKAALLLGYHRHKPYKKNIEALTLFLGINKIQEQVIEVLRDWFSENRGQNLQNEVQQLSQFHQQITLSRSEGALSLEGSEASLILELNGVIPQAESERSIRFCDIRNRLHHYQIAIRHTLKTLQREGFIVFQCDGPLKSLAWKQLGSQVFDGIEFDAVLKRYNADVDTNQADFSAAEKEQITKITQVLRKYLNQKEKPKDKQCDRHKHLHKNGLFKLLQPANIALFAESKPRLYQILKMQGERLAASVSKCSVKLMLRSYGLFSIYHHEKKALEREVIVSCEQQITERLKIV